MELKIDKGLLLCLTLGFIIFTVIGTLSHELGHYFVAKMLGYNASINYAFTSWFPKYPLQHISSFDSLLITLGGPIQTMLTGSIPSLYLWFNKAKYKESEFLTFQQWIWIFLSLFWLRQPMNFAMSLIGYFNSGNWSLNSDEFKIEIHFDLPTNSISFITALIGSAVLFWVVFSIIPKVQVCTFLCSGIVGGCLGYYLWLQCFGKMIMP